MRVLVTGGTGFLGRHLVWHAARLGHEVVFSGRNAAAATEVQRHAPAPVRWIALDHGDSNAGAILNHAAHGCDALIHCAALSSPWGRDADFVRANLVSTDEVLAACHTAQVPRLVHISTPSLYFDFRDRLDIPETAPLPPPVNAYVRTKIEAEARVRAAALPAVAILRPRALFGPWDQTLMPRLLRVMARGPMPLMRGGAIQLDLTYIDNAVDAVWRAATQPLPRALNLYNVSNGEPQSLRDVLDMVAREFAIPLRTRRVPWALVSLLARALELRARLGDHAEPPLTRYSAGVLAFSQTLSIRAAQEELGYAPRVSIAEGLRRHAQWWHAHSPSGGRT